ncbi:MAG: DUF5711 family protein, partial [Clostridia bacterium]|nr:DUF5711 family protein [Clostridia bacterium]
LVVSAAVFMKLTQANDQPEPVDVEIGVSSPDYGGQTEVFYNVESSQVIEIKPYRNGLAVLTQSSLIFVSSSGKTTGAFSHSFSNAHIETGGGVCVLYNRGSANYRIYRGSELLSDVKTECLVYLAAVSSNGKIAFAVRDKDCTSKLIILDKNGKELTQHVFNRESICAMDFQPGSRRLCVAATDAQNAVPYSVVAFFNTKDASEPEDRFSVEDKTVLRLASFSRRTMLICSDAVILYENSELNSLYDYTSVSLRSVSASDGLIAVRTALYNSDDSSELKIFNKTGYELASENLTGLRINRVSASDKHVVVLTRDSAVLYSKKGVNYKTVNDLSEPTDCVVNGSWLYILTSEGLIKAGF